MAARSSSGMTTSCYTLTACFDAKATAVTLRSHGDFAVLTRDATRSVRVVLEAISSSSSSVSHQKMLVASAWDPAAFSLLLNGVIYERGPVPLAAGDILQLCLPGEWSDDMPFAVLEGDSEMPEDEESGVPEEESGATVEVRPCSYNSQLRQTQNVCTCKSGALAFQSSLSPIAAAQPTVEEQLHRRAEAFAKWQNFYTHRFGFDGSDLEDSHDQDNRAGGGNGGRFLWHGDHICCAPSRMIVTHITNTDINSCFSAAGAPAPEMHIRLESSHERCCACPLLSQVSSRPKTWLPKNMGTEGDAGGAGEKVAGVVGESGEGSSTAAALTHSKDGESSAWRAYATYRTEYLCHQGDSVKPSATVPNEPSLTACPPSAQEEAMEKLLRRIQRLEFALRGPVYH